MHDITITADMENVGSYGRALGPEGIVRGVWGRIHDRDNVTAVHVKSEQDWEFGPSLDITYRDGRRTWLCFPGGHPHSGTYES